MVGETATKDARERREGIRGGGGKDSLQLLLCHVISLFHRVTEMEASRRTVKSNFMLHTCQHLVMKKRESDHEKVGK